MTEGKVRNTYLRFGNVKFSDDMLELPEKEQDRPVPNVIQYRTNGHYIINLLLTCESSYYNWL